MAGERGATGSELLIVDNSDERWEVAGYLREWCGISKQIDIATGHFSLYWEHLGLLDDPGYRARWERKRAEYLEAGVQPSEEDGGGTAMLIETRDDPGGSLDAEKIARLIERVLMP